MRIREISSQSIVEIPFLNAGQGPGGFYEDRLPILEAAVDRLPDGLDAIIATGDLQGRERFEESDGGPLRLLGETLPEQLADQILPDIGLSNANAIGVLLTGDFYTVPALDRRGGSGNVIPVWEAFGDAFGWVAGVAGNHDTFGPSPESRPRFARHVHFLDGDRVNLADLHIAGVGGIVGGSSKPWRRNEAEYVRMLETVLSGRTDILLTHDGPNVPGTDLKGKDSIRMVLEQFRPRLVVRGHAHWNTAMVELDGGVQVLNVDARVVVLREK